MKDLYVLLDKQYSDESLYDLDRDVSEIHDFPQDPDFKKDVKQDEHGFRQGTYFVKIVYIPDESEV